jgi:hypothetical protein
MNNILISGTLFFLIDYYTGKDTVYKSCKDHGKNMTLLYLHHIFATFLYTGWLSNNIKLLYLYIISIILTLLIQKYDNLCPITVHVYKNCNEQNLLVMRDFLYFFRLKTNTIKWPYYTLLLTGLSVAIYKIVKHI